MAKDDSLFYRRLSEYTPAVTATNFAATFLSSMVAIAIFGKYGTILPGIIFSVWLIKFLMTGSIVYIYTDRIYSKPFFKMLNKSQPIEVPFASLTHVKFGPMLPKQAQHIVHFFSPEISVYVKLPFYKTTKKKKFLAALKKHNVNVVELF